MTILPGTTYLLASWGWIAVEVLSAGYWPDHQLSEPGSGWNVWLLVAIGLLLAILGATTARLRAQARARTVDLTNKNLELQNEIFERERIDARLQQTYAELQQAHAELQQTHAELEQRVLERTLTLVQTNQRMHTEIEERTAAETAQKEALARWESLVQNAPDFIAIVNRDHTIQFINRVQPGFDIESVPGTSFLDYILPEFHEMVTENVDRAFDTGEIATYQVRGYGPHQEPIWYETRLSPLIIDGEVQYVTQISTDITVRKQTELSLRISEERFRVITELMSDFVYSFQVTRNGELALEWASDATLRAFGYTKEEIEGREWLFAAVHPDDQREAQTKIQARLAGTPTTGEYRVLSKFGQVYWIRDYGHPIWDDEKSRVVRIIGAAQNITARKEIETALVESEAKLQRILSAAPVGVIMCTNRVTRFVNQTLCEMLAYDAKELEGKNTRILYPTNFEYERVFQEKHPQLMASGSASIETQFQKKNGTIIDILMNSSLVEPGDLSAGIISTALDITERKRVEQEIQSALAEKEILLKEVHHRVKNNLQIICSLLGLQASSISDGKIVSALRDSEIRVRSMALVHENLYRSSNFSQVSMASHVNELTHHLFQTFKKTVQNIRFDTAIDDDLRLTIDTAVPLGLITNELISNAIKHAFPDGQSGNIRVKMYAVDGKCTLQVTDDGVGFPADFDRNNTNTLGFQLINALIHQLDATIALDECDGTCVTITCPI
jgi:PAS domain S-box-containing protein